MSRSGRRVAIVTGARAEYGLLRPVMRAVVEADLDLFIVASGTHLSPAHGNTVHEIEADGFEVAARVEVLPDADTPAATARAIGRGVVGFTDAFENLDPEIVLVLGDRSEIFAAATAAAATRRVLAHIHGGDRTRGGLDESYRHAITKLSHVHFAASDASRERIVAMGEPANSVHSVGAPGLDSLRSFEPFSRLEIAARLGVELPTPFVVVIQHAVSSDPASAAEQIRTTLRAIDRCQVPAVVVRPNNDPGGQRVNEVIDEYTGETPLHVFANLEHDLFLSLLTHTHALIGNSSCGIIEAPSLGLPVVDIGTRQNGRERADNVIAVDHEPNAIAAALNRAVHDDTFRERARHVTSPYGDGRASERIASILS
ncbi:MAG: UDP-N-acetylglucosamine 2-epimerase, partial [Planctomycetota bacterium]